MSFKGKLKSKFKDPTKKNNQMVIDENDEVVGVNNEININSLNDDSLVHIFKYLSIQEKLKIERVCKKWYSLSNFSWSNVNNLELNYPFQHENGLEEANKSFVTKFTINVFKKCGTYISSLTISFGLEVDFPIIFESISKYCKNIRCISIYESLDEINFNDDLLGLLFMNNPNICSVSLRRVNLNGSCFSSLKLENIEEILLYYCKIDTGYLYGFLSHLKNLKIMTIYTKNPVIIAEGMNALILSKCEGVTEINVSGIRATDLTKFLSRQKSLCKLKIDKIVNNDFINSIPISVQQIICSFKKEIPSSLCILKNLTILDCRIDNLDDKSINALIQCCNLKDVNIESEKYLLTSMGEYNFSKFKNIESFSLEVVHKVDIILIALSQCKSLKILNVGYCSISIIGIMGMHSICDLRKFIIDKLEENIIDEALVITVKKYVNLKTFTIRSYVSLEFLKLANEIKEMRGDKEILEIDCFGVNGGNDIDFNNEFPLIEVDC